MRADTGWLNRSKWLRISLSAASTLTTFEYYKMGIDSTEKPSKMSCLTRRYSRPARTPSMLRHTNRIRIRSTKLFCARRTHDVSYGCSGSNNRFDVQVEQNATNARHSCACLSVWQTILHKIHFYNASYTCIAALATRAHVMYS